jgi:exopolyphosphatase/guanosine-5'-triphosphate,3'-diphosphate pyrophosphatase
VEAAVDIGSNSVHLLVAVVARHRLEPLVDESVFLGLGAAADEGALGEARSTELVAALVSYVEAARRLGARSITLVGTEPLRRASDTSRVVALVRDASEVPLHVLTHEEEAYLTLLGVTAGRPVTGDLAVLDVGGGSSELVLVGPDRPAQAFGVRLGSARLTDRWAEHDPPTPADVAALRRAAAEGLEDSPPASPRELVAVGGTASNLLRVLPAAALDRTLTRRRLRDALGVLMTEPSLVAAERHAVNPVRARILPAGATILEAFLARYGLDRLHVSEAGIREGACLAASHAGRSWRDQLERLTHGWA